MSFPEHLHAALEQIQEHLLQSWELSLQDLRQQNEALRRELAERSAAQEETDQELLGLRAMQQDSFDLRERLEAQVEQLRLQLEQEAAQSSRLTLEMVDLKLEQEKERLRLRGLPDGPPKFNLPDLVEEEKPTNQDEILQRLAFQDEETGLPNLNLARRFLGMELEKLEKSTVALAVLELEDWRSLANLLTDAEERRQLLSQFAERVRLCLRPEDVLARAREDEYWLIFPLAGGGPLGQKTATELAQRSLSKLLDSLKTPFPVDDHKLCVNLWGGLAISQGADNCATVVRRARIASATARAKGSNRFGLFVPEMEKAARRREELAPLLRQALVREQFSLRFQPIVELKSGQIKGVEALVRWEHPLEGPLEPVDFLEAARQSGMIVGLGDWVMSCVCELSRGYRSLYWFINFSRPELMQADLPRKLTRAMEAAQLNRPDFIVLECREDDLAGTDPRVAANLKALKSWKVGLAADDFEFSELSLRRLDKQGVNFLKLSPAITQDLDQPLVRGLVKGGLLAAEAAGTRVILKGIENQGQLDLALESGCAWGQGHRLCSPLTWPELEARLTART